MPTFGTALRDREGLRHLLEARFRVHAAWNPPGPIPRELR